MDPTNAEVLTLKKDLVEVIELTADLVCLCLISILGAYMCLSGDHTDEFAITVDIQSGQHQH